MRDEIVERVRASQCARSAGEGAAEPVRYIAEYSGQREPTEIEASIRSVLRLDSRVTPLVQAHGEETLPQDSPLSRFYVVEVAGAEPGNLQPSPFEFGYALPMPPTRKPSSPNWGRTSSATMVALPKASITFHRGAGSTTAKIPPKRCRCGQSRRSRLWRPGP